MKEIRSICRTGLVLTVVAFGFSLLVRNYGSPSQSLALVASSWMLGVFGVAAGVAIVLNARDGGDFYRQLLDFSIGALVIGVIAVPLISCIFGHWYALVNTVAYNAGLILTVLVSITLHGRDEWLWSHDEQEQARHQEKIQERFGPRR